MLLKASSSAQAFINELYQQHTHPNNRATKSNPNYPHEVQVALKNIKVVKSDVMQDDK